MISTLVKRIYRVHKDQDKHIKKMSKVRRISESAYVRELLDKDQKSVSESESVGKKA